MRETTGRIVFVNSHDYVSDVLATPATGCMVVLRGDGGSDVVLYTGSLRLQHTLEMAYATRARVAVDYVETEAALTEQERLVGTATDRDPSRSFAGPFDLKALWTLE
jgi:hypothetical protein